MSCERVGSPRLVPRATRRRSGLREVADVDDSVICVDAEWSMAFMGPRMFIVEHVLVRFISAPHYSGGATSLGDTQVGLTEGRVNNKVDTRVACPPLGKSLRGPCCVCRLSSISATRPNRVCVDELAWQPTLITCIATASSDHPLPKPPTRQT
jgi:hypothetical protein